MLGLIGSALQGGAQAANEIADNSLKKKREKALLKIRQDFQTSEREAGQEFQTNERVAGQGFTLKRDKNTQKFQASESAADRAQRLSLAQMQENGANSRAAQGGWTLTKDANGNPVRFNTITGAQEPVEGISVPQPELTSQEEALKDVLLEERDRLMEQSMGQPDERTSGRLGEIDARLEDLLGISLTSNLADRVTRDVGGAVSQESGESSGNSNLGGNDGEVKPPPGVGDPVKTEEGQGGSRVTGLINQGISEQQNKQSEAQEDRVLRDIDQQIRQMKSQIRIAGTGPGVTQAERDAAAEKVIQMAKELEDNGLMDSMQSVQSEAIQDIVNQAVQYSSQY